MLEAPRTPFREKIAYYAFGVAIGFCLLGMIWLNRARMNQQPNQQRQAGPAEATPAPAPAGAPPAAPGP